MAQHIATIYLWYAGMLTKVYDLAADRLERGKPEDIKATLDLFEKNVEKARGALSAIAESNLQDPWTMKAGDRTVLGPLPRGAAAI